MTNIEIAAPAKRAPRAAVRPNGRANGHDIDAIDTGELLSALRAFRRGDFSVRLPRGHRGMNGGRARSITAPACPPRRAPGPPALTRSTR